MGLLTDRQKQIATEMYLSGFSITEICDRTHRYFAEVNDYLTIAGIRKPRERICKHCLSKFESKVYKPYCEGCFKTTVHSGESEETKKLERRKAASRKIANVQGVAYVE